MSKLKLGIIGYGNMGSWHVEYVHDGKVPSMELAAACDNDPERLKELREKYPELPVFENATDMYKSGLCDTVLIAVPHYDHASLAIEAFSYGLHVVTEKPAGVYTKQVREMNEVAAKSDKAFGIMYNQRTAPTYAKLRAMVQNGELGNIKRVTWIITDWYRPQAYHNSSSWRSTWKGEGGGALINQNPHQLDLFQWIFGMPDRIYARASYGKYYDIEVEDEVTAFFEYDNGMSAQYITCTGETPGTNRLEIACDMGKIVIENGQMIFHRNVVSERIHNEQNKAPFAKPECWECKLPIPQGPAIPHGAILENFAQAVLNGKPMLAPGEEGINGLTISNAIHLSSWTGEVIDVKNFPEDRYYDLLQEHIANSKVVKKVERVVADTAGTY